MAMAHSSCGAFCIMAGPNPDQAAIVKDFIVARGSKTETCRIREAARLLLLDPLANVEHIIPEFWGEDVGVIVEALLRARDERLAGIPRPLDLPVDPMVSTMIGRYFQTEGHRVLGVVEVNHADDDVVGLARTNGVLPREATLLWHGTSTVHLENILRVGLRIFPGTRHGKLGKGLYFTDKASAAMKYCYCDGAGVLLLVSVTLGKVKKCYDPRPQLLCAPTGFHSVHGVSARGRALVSMPGDRGLLVPLGTHEHQCLPTQTTFLFNEYAVYSNLDARVEYLVAFRRD